MTEKTTNAQLIAAIAAATEMSKTDVDRVLQGFTAIVTTSLNDGKSVTVTSLGAFKPTHRKARVGRNPATGAPLEIAASNGASFSAAKALKDALN